MRLNKNDAVFHLPDQGEVPMGDMKGVSIVVTPRGEAHLVLVKDAYGWESNVEYLCRVSPQGMQRLVLQATRAMVLQSERLAIEARSLDG